MTTATAKKRYRADVLIEDQIAKYEEKINKEIAKAAKKFGDSFDEQKFRETNPRVLEHQQKRDALHQRYSDAMNAGDLNELKQIILDEGIVCPISGTHNWTDVRQFNLMFKNRGRFYGRRFFHYLPASGNRPRHLRELPERAEDGAHEAAFRYRTDRQGVPQRNRGPSVYFPYARVRADGNAVLRDARREAMQWFKTWKTTRYGMASGYWASETENYRYHDHEKLAHYANAASDIEFHMPFGFKEVEGIHSRTNFDLSQHAKYSGKKIEYFDPETNESYTPYVIETSIGVDRVFLSIMCHSS